MAGYFSVIVALHLLAALVVITPSADALKCYETSEVCDKETCVYNEPAASSSKTFDESECDFRKDTLVKGLKKLPGEMKKALAQVVDELDENKKESIFNDLVIVFARVEQSVLESEPTGKQHLCSRIVSTLTIKVSGKSLQKTSVVRGCTFSVPQCEMYGVTSLSGDVDVKVNLCSSEGDNSNNEGRNIVASKVLLLAPLILMGISACIAVPTSN